MLKPKRIEIPKFQSMTEAVLFVLKIMDDDKEELQKIITIIMECIDKEIVANSLIYKAICDTVDIDFGDLSKSTREYINNNWANIKEKIREENDLAKKINEIFKNKHGDNRQ